MAKALMLLFAHWEHATVGVIGIGVLGLISIANITSKLQVAGRAQEIIKAREAGLSKR